MQNTIGILTAVGACLFVLVGLTMGGELPTRQSPAGPMPFLLLATFCVVISVACFSKRSRPVTLRIIGAVLCAAFTIPAFNKYGTENFLQALAGFVLIGLPCGYLMITGRYPGGGYAGAAFQPKDHSATDNEG